MTKTPVKTKPVVSKMEIGEWRKEFKKILGGYCWYQDGGNGGYSFEDVTKFINNLLTLQAQQQRERIKELNEIIDSIGIVEYAIKETRNQLRSELREKLKITK